jgi:hypothetical protein
LELNNKRDYAVVQALYSEICGDSRLRLSHPLDAYPNILGPNAQSPEHLDPEGLVAGVVQTFQPRRYTTDFGGRQTQAEGNLSVG